jgi:hypothetical protein
MWNYEKDRARRDGYISFTASFLIVAILAVIAAPICAAVFFKIVLDEDNEVFRINIRRK